MVKGLWHFSFTVSDLDRSLEFYCGLLGMQLRLEQRQANPYTRRLVGYPDAILGPTALGSAFPPLVTMALRAACCEARNGYCLASKRVPLVLETEESAGRTDKARDRCGGSGVDSQDEFSKSALGSAADPWGTAQQLQQCLRELAELNKQRNFQRAREGDA